MDSNILAAALEYASKGWYVLPLMPNKKTPLGKLVPTGHKNATIDADTIHAWWEAYPDANIGVRVGIESGLLIFDIDNKNGKNGGLSLTNLQLEIGALPDTYTEVTPTGGIHLYYKFPPELYDKPRRNELGRNSGIDVKSRGYVVAAPSVLDDGNYSVVNNIGVSELPGVWINTCIKPQSEVSVTMSRNDCGENTTICEKHGISLQDVMDIPVGIRRAGEGYLCTHMVHGSTGDGNLSINFDKGVFHCFRHDTGGDALVWIAIREGYIDCADAGSLEKEVVLKCVEKLQEDGLIAPTKTRRLLHENAVELEEIL